MQDWPTGLMPVGRINGVPFINGQPYVVLPCGTTVTLVWK